MLATGGQCHLAGHGLLDHANDVFRDRRGVFLDRHVLAGEDPDQIEREIGDQLESEDPFVTAGAGGLRALRRKIRPPAVD